mmetsp:Transcript_36440/g.102725  ORF Transcript_36440/g.102725 Transcript_36440/m.102725 type:complete len:255 (-) Transcript_36440:423-1187(-)
MTFAPIQIELGVRGPVFAHGAAQFAACPKQAAAVPLGPFADPAERRDDWRGPGDPECVEQAHASTMMPTARARGAACGVKPEPPGPPGPAPLAAAAGAESDALPGFDDDFLWPFGPAGGSSGSSALPAQRRGVCRAADESCAAADRDQDWTPAEDEAGLRGTPRARAVPASCHRAPSFGLSPTSGAPSPCAAGASPGSAGRSPGSAGARALQQKRRVENARALIRRGGQFCMEVPEKEPVFKLLDVIKFVACSQ